MDEPTNIRISTEMHGSAAVVRPVGDIDLSRSPVLREEIKKALGSKPARLVVDLAGVEYMDSSGVATLVEAMQLTKRGGHELVICSLTDRVRSIFEIARLEQVFAIEPDVASALDRR
ncbi:MAG: STAS domain-containing protein [Phycisphaerales bacterium]